MAHISGRFWMLPLLVALGFPSCNDKPTADRSDLVVESDEGTGDDDRAVEPGEPTESVDGARDAPPDQTLQPMWYDGLVFYEIFVRSFFDSDGDGIGDIRGIISKLDYLNDGRPGRGDDLEVDGLWLMPIFQSPSYHGYDTIDYLAVESDYGTNDDLADLIEACHARGMRLILDLMLNHSSSEHPWFIDARTGPGSDHRDYYSWRQDDPGWTQPWSNRSTWHRAGEFYYYGLFWSGMPDLDYHSPQVVSQMTDVARHWLEMGIDGYRLDAARHLFESEDGVLSDVPETHGFFRDFRDDLGEGRPNVYLVGEVWAPRESVSPYYGGGEEFHQCFDFSLAEAIEQTVLEGRPDRLREEIGSQAAAGTPWSFEATFLSNHDMIRLADRLGEPWRQRAAATLLLTLPGTAYLYYGDEFGMTQSSGNGDEAKRAPMPWDGSISAGFSTGDPWYPLSGGHDVRNVASQLADPHSLLHHHRRLVALRHRYSALRSAEGLRLLESGQEGLFAMLRYDAEAILLVLVNVSGAERTLQPLDLAEHTDVLGCGSWSSEVVMGSGEGTDEIDQLSQFPLGAALGPGESRVVSIRSQQR